MGDGPNEAPDSGRSKQRVRIVEAISEGEIYSLVNGLRSVYLDNTPIQGANGEYNFPNVDVQWRMGSQAQSVMADFGSTEKEISVGTEVRQATPIIRTVTDSKVNRLRLTLGVSSLFKQEDNGDTTGAKVEFKITVGNEIYMHTVEGKYSSQYLHNVIIYPLPPVPFTIKVERVTEDSNSLRLQNKTIWASYTEIINTEFTYPNTALIGIKFDSDYFSNIPTRSYEVYGIKVLVPSNYNPQTRRYSGLWDGSFKLAYSDNPAWVLMDIVTNKRYGLGQRLMGFGVDKWTLYQVAQYCDQMIPDGYGGTEPRFTCNVWLTEQRSAYEVINDICSIFRAMPVWNGTELTVIMDRPSDPVWTYTNANVINGEFSRQYSAMKSRHNAIQVEYQDAANSYEKAIEYVSNDDDIRKYGLNLKKVTAFGCTSRGQAYRTGRWILETERLETETITFSVGAEGLMHIPGDIIRVSDNHYAGTEIGGRVLAINGREVTLDREITLSGNSFFSYINAEAKHRNLRIHKVKGNVITLDSQPLGLEEMGVWSLTTQSITSQLYRAMSIRENEDGSYTITALQHEPQKEAIVDNGASFEPRSTTLYKAPHLENLDIELSNGRVKFGWQTSSGEGTVTYDVRIFKGGRLYASYTGLKNSELAFDELPDGEYIAVIQARNGRGQIISTLTKAFVIDRPPVPRDVRVVGGLGDISLSWDYVDDVTQTEIWVSEVDDIFTAKRAAKVLASFYSHPVGSNQVRYYWVRHTRGQNKGPFYQEQGLRGESGADIDEEMRKLEEKLRQPIIDEVFDVAAPARQLEMLKLVASLPNPEEFLGHSLVKNQEDGRIYKWNGQRYTADTPASEITGSILPEQLADIPASKLSGQLTDAQLSQISAGKITGAISASQLAAIPTSKLSGTISAHQLAANSVGANAIQAGAIGTQQLAANAVVAEKLAANSIGSNHIRANAVSAGHLQANSVATGHLQAGAVRAEHVAAGQLSADKLAIGLGGNLLTNPIFSTSEKNNEGNEVPFNWNYWRGDSSTYDGVSGLFEYRKSGGQNDWALQHGLPNENTASMTRQISQARNVDERVGWLNQDVPVIAGKTYMASCWLAAHRGKVKLVIENLSKETGNYTGLNAESDYVYEHQGNAAGRDFSRYVRKFVKFTAPASGYIRFALSLHSIDGGEQPWAFMLRPMLEECTRHTIEPSPWQNAGVTSIHGGSIVAQSITAQQLAVGSITTEKMVAGTIDGKVLRTGTIGAMHIQSHSISADKLRIQTLSAVSSNLGSITAGTITGTTISGNNIIGGSIFGTKITGTTIEGGTIRGAYIEGVTVAAENIIGDVMRVFAVTFSGGGTGKTRLSLDIPAGKRRRAAYLMPVLLNSRGHKDNIGGERDRWVWNDTQYAKVFVKLGEQTVLSNQAQGGNFSAALQGVFHIPENRGHRINIDIENYNFGLAKETQFAFFIANG